MIYRTILILFSLLTVLSCNKQPVKPNVILIIIDTIRADHMGAYGYGRNTTPNLDAFANANIKFNYAISATPWTPSAVASVFTGLYTSQHRMMPPSEKKLAKQISTKLNPNLDTLASAFSRSGYYTSGITQNPWMGKEFHYNKGFNSYKHYDRVNADKTITGALKELEKLNSSEAKDKPWFLYLHLLDPHDPYESPKPFDSMFGGVPPSTPPDFQYSEKMLNYLNAYDGEIAFTDQEIGRLFKTMKDKGWYDNTAIVIVGDHGEQFSEHGDHRHGLQLYNEEVHVPLFLKLPGSTSKGRVVSETVSQVDIYPTLLELAKIQKNNPSKGVSLIDQEAIEKRKGVLSEIRRRYDEKAFIDNAGRKIIFGVDFQMETASWETSDELWKGEPKFIGVFDRKKDYQERTPLQDPQLKQNLEKQFWQHYKEITSENKPAEDEGHTDKEENISKESLEKIRSLGYVE